MVAYSTDKVRLLDHFRKDPALFAYHIGDLDPFHFDLCSWAVLPDESGWIEECILFYRGLATPTVLAFGLGERFEDFLVELMPELPPSFFGHFQERSREVLTRAYRLTDYGNNYKMQLMDFKPAALSIDRDNIVSLTPDHLPLLEELYSEAYPGNFFMPRMLESGKYLGYMEQDHLAAVTGVHVYSEEFGVCALGNITTHPSYRNRGLATQLTSVLLEQVTAKNLAVCLNVRVVNAAAIKSYQKLGFEIVHEYREGLLEKA